MFHTHCTNKAYGLPTNHSVAPKYQPFSKHPSPATAKGHMKQPRRSTRTPTSIRENVTTQLSPEMVDIHEPPRPLIPFALHPNVIEDDDMANMMLNANLYCFTAFADKHTGTLYNDLTGTFPFMLLEGNICFLILYHYESNAILALPISGFSDDHFPSIQRNFMK